jgi:hypothetical protein
MNTYQFLLIWAHTFPNLLIDTHLSKKSNRSVVIPMMALDLDLLLRRAGVALPLAKAIQGKESVRTVS